MNPDKIWQTNIWFKARTALPVFSWVVVGIFCVSCGNLKLGSKGHPKRFSETQHQASQSHTEIGPLLGPPEFQAYDRKLNSAIVNRWCELLDSRDFSQKEPGKVIVQFRLHSDGRVSNVKVVERTVGTVLALMCEKAILDPAPFESWPDEMRAMVADDYREIHFTFYYDTPIPKNQRKR